MSDRDLAAETDTRGEIDDPAVVLDPEEYTQHRRLRELYDLRAEVQRTRRQIGFLAAQGNLSRGDSNAAYLATLKAYLMELEPLAIHQYPETGEAYWYNAGLPDAEFRPEADTFEQDPENPPDAVRVEFGGLADIVTVTTPLTVEFTARLDPPHATPKTVTVTEDRPIPRRVLDTAYRQANLFLADIGMDLDPERDDGPGTLDLDQFV